MNRHGSIRAIELKVALSISRLHDVNTNFRAKACHWCKLHIVDATAKIVLLIN